MNEATDELPPTIGDLVLVAFALDSVLSGLFRSSMLEWFTSPN